MQIRHYAKLTATVFALAACVHYSSAQTGLSLQNALRTARENNRLLKSEQLNMGMAQSDIVTAGLRPNLTLNNQTLQLVQPTHFAANTQWHNGSNRQVWWQLTKVFQPPTQRRLKIDLAKETLTLTEKNYAETQRNVYLDVADKWLELWTAQKRLDIILIAKSNVDSLVNTNKIRLKNQVITETDLMRTELLANQYDLQYKSARQDFVNLKREFNFLLGVSDSMGVDTADTFRYAIPPDVDTLLNEALNHRSDVQTLQTGMKAAEVNTRLQKIMAWPQPELGVVWNPQNRIQYVGIYATIDLPVFSRNQGEIRKSQFIKQQVEQELGTLQNKIQTEIRSAYASYILQEQRLNKYQSIIRNSQTILDNVRYTYLKGGTTIIDYLEAQRSWLDIQQQYYDALLQYRQSYVQLLYTTGLINQLAQ